MKRCLGAEFAERFGLRWEWRRHMGVVLRVMSSRHWLDSCGER
jgi:hypothetical protein